MYTFPNWVFPLEFPCFKETWKKSLMGPIGIYLGLGKKQGLLEMAKLLNNPLSSPTFSLLAIYTILKCFKLLPTLYSNGYGLGSNPLYTVVNSWKPSWKKTPLKNAARRIWSKIFYVVSHSDGLKLENSTVICKL